MTVVAATAQVTPSLKYDLLSALTIFSLSGGPIEQRRALRFAALLTARYNWARDELSIGRAEIARLWHVTERTVKREMAFFRNAGWVRVKRPAARGRVAVYSIGIDAVLRATKPAWPLIGPDFVARMTGGPSVPAVGNVVPFSPAPQTLPDGQTRWAQVARLLSDTDPQKYAAWYAQLTEHEPAPGRVELSAPTAFVADYVRTHLMPPLRQAYALVDASIDTIHVVSSPR